MKKKIIASCILAGLFLWICNFNVLAKELDPPSGMPSDVVELWQNMMKEQEKTEYYIGTYELTAYTWTGNPCADGVYPSSGFTAASNDSRLWHHWIYIEGYGEVYVHDTGGMASNVIDIYMDSYDSCIQFGRRTANIYIID